MSTVITRFAPSPTGNLHIGTARTAIFSYLYAQSQGGRMLLRIEDTDRERSTEASVQNILDGLTWLGITYHGEPVRQSPRLKIYQEHAEQLLRSGHAYEEKDPEKGTAIRFKSEKRVHKYHDLILGDSEKEAYDFVLLKSDGYPTYNFAVVIDDNAMDITHVIRGNDLLASMPLQVALYEAFGWKAPQFAHLPLILGADKQKLSKRHGATSITEYRDMGYLADATFNFLTLLGWAPGNDQEIISRAETIAKFDIKDCRKAPAVFDMQKFQWMNKQYIMAKPVGELKQLMGRQIDEAGLDMGGKPAEYIEKLLTLYHDRIDNLLHFVPQIRFFFDRDVAFNDDDVRQVLKKDAELSRKIMTESAAALTNAEWTVAALDAALRGVAEKLGVGFGKVAQPVRVATTGTRVSAGLFETLELLGRETVLRRLRHTLDVVLAA